ncbi:diguanylate cyclase [Clostridioides difficile]|nr:diguanylate cyclase [Clostridioides difficile]
MNSMKIEQSLQKNYKFNKDDLRKSILPNVDASSVFSEIKDRINPDECIAYQIALPIATIRIDANDHQSIIWYNDKFLEMLDYTKEQYIKEENVYYNCIDFDDFSRVSRLAQNFDETGDSVALEVKVYTRTKEEKIWAVTLYYVDEKESMDGISSIYCFGMDMTIEKKKNNSFVHMVERDPLTNALNRVETEKQIQDYIQERPNGQGCLFMIDTDDFKTINDTKGHIVGDMVLCEMAKGMKQIMRSNDIVGRIGGDEFIIFMKDSDSDGARKKARDLIEMFQQLFANEKNNFTISCSIGISLYPENGPNFKELYSNADKALYQVKKQGKNNYMLYDEISLEQKISSYTSIRTKIETEKADGNISIVGYVFTTLYESNNFDQSIKEVLSLIGKQFEVSRAYIFENAEDNLTTSNTYEWCNEGITPEIDGLQNLDFEEYGNYEQLFGDDSIFYCRDINILPYDQKKILSEQGICSTLQCAILEDSVFTGFIGFDECTGLRIWTQKEIDLLIMMSQLISLFLQKKKLKGIKNKANNYQKILYNLEECIFVIEKGNDALLYGNSKFKYYFPNFKLGQRCHIAVRNSIPILWDEKEANLYSMKI